MTKKNALKKQARVHKSENFTFSDHIRELRRRVLWVALFFGVASSLAYNYHDQLVQIVMAPLKGEKLVYLTPGGGFSFIFQITLYAGLIAAGPALMYQIYKFVQPSLPTYAQRGALKVAFFATLLMILGVGYGYFIAVPAALQFLSTFAGENIIPNLTADSYLSFFLSYVGGLALLFQLPLLLILWNWIKPIGPGSLLKSERLVIALAFIVAALITPTPDVVNQAMIAGPLIALYQIGVFVVLSMHLRNRRHATISQTKKQSEVSFAYQPAPVQAPSTQPIAQPTHRPVDGFAKSPSPLPTSVIAPASTSPRPLTVPSRPHTSPPQRLHRRPLSIDGISPA